MRSGRQSPSVMAEFTMERAELRQEVKQGRFRLLT